ncbi:MAG: hypothetical protein VYA30_03765 [Myxococcota bacterium]|nr:hypothetical protein [Myxococcota bacterium]
MKAAYLAAAILAFTCIGCSTDSSSDNTNDAGTGSDAHRLQDGDLIVGERPMATFELSATYQETEFGLVPFPNNVYLNEQGFVSVDGFPHQTGGSMLSTLIGNLRNYTRGFGTAATMYLPMDGPLIEATLPATAAASMEANSALQLVDIDPSSPEYGRRFPVNWRVQETASLYLAPHALKVRLTEGLTLRGSTTYALVLTDAAAIPNDTFSVLTAPEPPNGTLAGAWSIYQPLRDWASENDIKAATAAVFTTQDPVGEMFHLRDFLHEQPVPQIRELESLGTRLGLFELFVGKYTAPRMQSGELPFLAPDSGGIQFDANGVPVIGGEEEIRFAITVPLEGEMPEGGWPVVLYGHGTGGDYQSFVGAKVAVTLARAGIAVVSIDQLHHGYRDRRDDGCHTSPDPDGCVSLLFFNFLIPTAGRDNVRQSALDYVTLLRLVRDFNRQLAEGEADIRTTRARNPERPARPQDAGVAMDAGQMQDGDIGDASPPEMDTGLVADQGLTGHLDAGEAGDAGIAELSDANADTSLDNQDLGIEDAGARPDIETTPTLDLTNLKLDGDRVVYMGHSQGGLNGPLFMAVEPDIKGGVLSAAGGLLAITLEQKTKPTDINELVSAFVPIAEAGVLDRWHPVLGLLQLFIEPGDPVNYAPFWFHEPLEGTPPRHIFMTAGLDDEYTTPDSMFALAAAGRVPIIEPVQAPIELFELYDIEPAGIPPYSGNVANGRASAGLVQLRNAGHFVIQRNVTLRNRYRRFVESIFLGNPSIF